MDESADAAQDAQSTDSVLIEPKSLVKEDAPVNRETKLALLLGFCAIVVVGVLVGEHFSKGRNDRPATTELGLSSSAAPSNPSMPGTVFEGDPYATTLTQQPVKPVVLTMDPAASPEVVPVSKPVVLAGGPREDQADSNASGVIRPNRDTFVPAAGTAGSAIPTVAGGQTRETDSFVPETRPVETVPSLPISAGVEKLHPVKRGETVASLAEKYYGDKGYSKQLSEYNQKRLSPNGSVREGVTLRIPPRDVLLGKAMLASGSYGKTDFDPAIVKPVVTKPEANTKPVKPETKVTSKPEPKPEAAKTTTYIVKKGDTLGHISQATLGTSKRWQEILKANKGLSEDNLRVGMKLNIPAK